MSAAQVEVLQNSDATCNACAEEIRRATVQKRTPRMHVLIFPHAATFLVQRESPFGLLVSTACERSLAETLLAFEGAANGSESCGDELTPGVCCVLQRHAVGANHRAIDGREWR